MWEAAVARVPTRTKIEPQVSTHDSNVLPVVCVLYAFSDSWMEFYVGGGGTNTGRTTAVTCEPTKAYPRGAATPVDLWIAKPGGGAEGPALGLNGSFPCAAEPPASMHIPGAPEVNVCPNDNDGSGCPPYPGWPGDQLEGCKYEDALFTDFMLQSIQDH